METYQKSPVLVPVLNFRRSRHPRPFAGFLLISINHDDRSPTHALRLHGPIVM